MSCLIRAMHGRIQAAEALTFGKHELSTAVDVVRHVSCTSGDARDQFCCGGVGEAV